jgi:hypothetical protein
MKEAHIVLPFLPPAELRGNSRAHWAIKARKAKQMRSSGYWHGLDDCIDLRHLERVSVKYTFSNFRKIDLDNLVIGMKSWADGCLVDAEIVPDDNPDHVQLEAPEFTKTKKGDEKTIIDIKEIAPQPRTLLSLYSEQRRTRGKGRKINAK